MTTETIPRADASTTPPVRPRAALRALSVFPGGFTEEAAGHVLPPGADVLGTLELLADQSLLAAADTGAGVRFRMLETVRAAGFELPPDDDGRLHVRRPLPDLDAALPSEPRSPLAVVHPGTSAPARAYPEPLWVSAVDRLVQDGWQVALTGDAAEKPLTGRIVDAVDAAAPDVLDLAGRLDLPRLAALSGGRIEVSKPPVQ